MDIVQIHKITAENEAFVYSIDMDIDLGGGVERVNFVYRFDDEEITTYEVLSWLQSNPDFPIDPYEAPPPFNPLTVDLPRREFRRALLHNGMDTAAVLAVIEAIPAPAEREEMQIWWEDTVQFQRSHPALVDMVAAAGLTPEQGDGIWAYGVALLNGA